MRHFAAVCVFLLGMAVSGFAHAPAPKPLSPLEQTLVTAEKNFIDAAKTGDTASLKRILADDFSFVGSDG